MITFTLWSLATPGVMASTDQHAHSNKGKLIWPWDRITTVNHCFSVSEYIDINKGVCPIFYFWRWQTRNFFIKKKKGK